MALYRLTNKAVNDLSDIWTYTCETWSEQQADKYYRALIEQIEKLAKNPQIGKWYHEIFPELIGYRINHHIIFYKTVSSKEIEVIRILHKKMDYKHRMLD